MHRICPKFHFRKTVHVSIVVDLGLVHNINCTFFIGGNPYFNQRAPNSLSVRLLLT